MISAPPIEVSRFANPDHVEAINERVGNLVVDHGLDSIVTVTLIDASVGLPVLTSPVLEALADPIYGLTDSEFTDAINGPTKKHNPVIKTVVGCVTPFRPHTADMPATIELQPTVGGSLKHVPTNLWQKLEGDLGILHRLPRPLPRNPLPLTVGRVVPSDEAPWTPDVRVALSALRSDFGAEKMPLHLGPALKHRGLLDPHFDWQGELRSS